MLNKVNNSQIISQTRAIQISKEVELYTEILSMEAESDERKLLFIHGGGTAANHTLAVRPARWLIDQGVYDQIILPDRRGCGYSTPLQDVLSVQDHAEDHQALLDQLNDIDNLDVMGISYGGPIALVLAAIDSRIERAILYAASPQMNLSWPWNWLIQSGFVPLLMRWFYKRYIGDKPAAYPDLDIAYETSNQKEDWEAYKQALQHTPSERLDSILLEFEAAQDPEKARVPKDINTSKPILRVIGAEDQTWGSEWPQEFQQQFPNFQQTLIPEADHKDAIRKAEKFLKAIKQIIQEDRARKKRSIQIGQPQPEVR